MDLIKMLRDKLSEPFDPLDQYTQYGIKSPIKKGDMLSTTLGVLPGIGDAISAKDAVSAAEKGNYSEALFNSLGMLPFIPAVGGAIRKAETSLSNVPPKIGPATSDEPAYLAKRASDIIKRKYMQTMGTQDDPVYDIIYTGVFDNITDTNRYINEMDGGYPEDVIMEHGLPDDIEEDSASVLDAFRERQGTETQTGEYMTEALYDYNLVSNAYSFDNVYQQYLNSVARGNGDFYDDEYVKLLTGAAKNPENFNKPFFAGPIFEPMKTRDTRYEDEILRRLQSGELSTQAVKDVRFTLTDLFNWVEKSEREQLNKLYSEQSMKVDTAHEYPDGYRWVSIKDPDALNAEGKLMNHCVGGYCEQVSKDLSHIWSLRDKDNKPHVTIETSPFGNIRQVFGNSNSPVKLDYQPYVNHFKKSLINDKLYPLGKKLEWPDPEGQI